MVASTGFALYYTLSITMYVQAYVPGVNLPWWLIPSYEVLTSGSPLHRAWIVPILFHLILMVISTLLGFVTALTISDLVLKRKSAKFPIYSANGITIDTCFQEDQQTQFMFKWLGIGIAVTLGQYGLNYFLEPLGFSLISWDFTPQLPAGFALGLMLNIGLMAITYIIDPKISITMLLAGIVTYLVISPLLTAAGLLTPGVTGMDTYFNLLFQFSLSPALGIMLLSGFVVLGVTKFKNRLNHPEGDSKSSSNPDTPSNDSLSFGEYINGFFSELIKNPILAGVYILLVCLFLILVIGFSIFSSFSIGMSIIFSLILLIPIAIVDVFVLIKFVGETGIGMGAQRIAFYEIPLATTGLVGYTPFIAYPRINPWTTTDILGNLKIGQITKTQRRDILMAQLLKILPGLFTSVIFVIAAWYFIGFPSESFPAIGVLQGFAIISIFATRSSGIAFNPVTFLLGGLISGLLAVFAPIAPLGIAFAMFMPPSYFIPASLGGFLRLYTNRKYGNEWFQKRGQIIAIGFIAGAAITQVIMSFL